MLKDGKEYIDQKCTWCVRHKMKEKGRDGSR